MLWMFAPVALAAVKRSTSSFSVDRRSSRSTSDSISLIILSRVDTGVLWSFANSVRRILRSDLSNPIFTSAESFWRSSPVDKFVGGLSTFVTLRYSWTLITLAKICSLVKLRSTISSPMSIPPSGLRHKP